MNANERLRVLLVDPSLFTAPYDAALTDGLVAAGVEPLWAVRPTRRGDRQEIPADYVDDFFYRSVDEMRLPARLRAYAKGIAHGLGLLRLIRRVREQRPDAVHFQWLVVPALDTLAILLIRRWARVVVTVHDTVPFNGETAPIWQRLAFDLPLRIVDGVIVHTRAGHAALVARGVPDQKLAIIPHGPLQLRVPVDDAPAQQDERWTFLLFGELKTYKGLDLLIEAVARLPEATRARARFIIAGRPRMDLAPLLARVAELGLESAVEIRPGRLSEEEMAALFAETDCFLFPYRQVDASGVYFLVKGLGKWLIASRLGVFAEDVVEGVQGTLVTPGDIAALSGAIADAVHQQKRPATVSSPDRTWAAIGHATRAVYARVPDLAERRYALG